jgi:putative oxidoreductase
MQKIFHFADGRVGVGLLILRLVMGLGLMSHGWFKIQKPFGWMGPDGVTGPLQALAALSEFGGGLAITLGFLTPLAALGVLCTMIGAWYFGNQGNPWLSLDPKTKTFELAALYGTLAVILFFTGPGRFSIDALIWGRKKR